MAQRNGRELMRPASRSRALTACIYEPESAVFQSYHHESHSGAEAEPVDEAEAEVPKAAGGGERGGAEAAGAGGGGGAEAAGAGGRAGAEAGRK
eukprot:5978863-Karenia_brevis.AAC.1